jgi:hypothetical protein
VVKEANTMSEIRSRKVKKILKLRARSAKLRARYEQALAKVEPAKHKAEQFCQEARAIEATLTGSQLAELRRESSDGE